MWSATVGATPVKRWTWAASAIFSYGSRGTPFWAKTLKRVPELPNAHDGSSMCWDLSVATTAGLLVTSASDDSLNRLSWCRSGRRGRDGAPEEEAPRGRRPETGCQDALEVLSLVGVDARSDHER